VGGQGAMVGEDHSNKTGKSGVKWSAPEKSPDLAHAEHILVSGRVWAIVIPAPGFSCILGQLPTLLA
jgi:hypothetical protein